MQLPLTPTYDDGTTHLTATSVDVALDLSQGDHEYTGSWVPVGSHHLLTVSAQLRFGYHFDSASRKLTIRGNDDRTTQQLAISLVVTDGPVIDPTGALGSTSPNFPGVTVTPNTLPDESQVVDASVPLANPLTRIGDAVAPVARECNNQIIAQSLEPRSTIRSVTEIGTPPVVTYDTLNDFRAYFGQPPVPDSEKTEALLAETQVRVASTYVGPAHWNIGDFFANILGSSGDPKINKQLWIDLWAAKVNHGNKNVNCSSADTFFDPHTHHQLPGQHCQGVMTGGHVIPGTVAATVPYGHTAYIWPICNRHNVKQGATYMELLHNTTGVELRYLVKPLSE